MCLDCVCVCVGGRCVCNCVYSVDQRLLSLEPDEDHGCVCVRAYVCVYVSTPSFGHGSEPVFVMRDPLDDLIG